MNTLEIQKLLTAAGLHYASTSLVTILAHHALKHFKTFTFQDAQSLANEINNTITSAALFMKKWVQETPYWKEGPIPDNIRERLLPLLTVVATHKAMDQEIQKVTIPKDVKISCQKKCSFCCHYPVSISDTEALYLALLVKAGSIPIDTDLLESQQKMQNLDEWVMSSNKETRCVFLAQDKTCMVYASRPSSCRSYMVRSAPKLCDQEKYRGQKVDGVALSEVEILSSTQVTYGGLLPQKVKKALESLTNEDMLMFIHLTEWYKSLQVLK